MALVGYRPDGSQASALNNSIALQRAATALNPRNAITGGGELEIPAGYGFINRPLDIPWGVSITSHGAFIALADGSNCPMIRTHTSAGVHDTNAFLSTISGLWLDGRRSRQIGVWPGIFLETRPLLEVGDSGDYGFDPSHNVIGCFLKNLGAGIVSRGRSNHKLIANTIEQCGIGIDTMFDTHMDHNSVGFCSAGIIMRNSSCQLSGNKTYNCLDIALSALGAGELSIAAHSCQNNRGTSYRFTNCRGLNVQGCSSTPGLGGDPMKSYHVELDGVTGSIISIAGLGQPGSIGYRMINSADNELHITHTAGPAFSVDTVNDGNGVWINGKELV